MKTNNLDRYRFDNAYSNVYRLSEDGSYLFLASYYDAGIETRNLQRTKIRKIEAWENTKFQESVEADAADAWNRGEQS